MQKIWRIMKTAVTWILLVAAVAMMVFTVVSVATFDRTDRDFFGYKAFVALSDSMKATDFDAGDLVLVREVDPTTLAVGDIISYISTNEHNYGETVTHKIRTLTKDAEGNPGFITYGTSTDTDDEKVVTYPYILGKYQFAIPNVGHFFQFLKTTPGYIVCILLPFLGLILIQGIQTVRVFRQYQAEQRSELAAERAALAAEREESKRMMEALLAMQAVQGKPAEPQPAAPDPDDPTDPEHYDPSAEMQRMMEELEQLKARLAEKEASGE